MEERIVKINSVWIAEIETYQGDNYLYCYDSEPTLESVLIDFITDDDGSLDDYEWYEKYTRVVIGLK